MLLLLHLLLLLPLWSVLHFVTFGVAVAPFVASAAFVACVLFLWFAAFRSLGCTRYLWCCFGCFCPALAALQVWLLVVSWPPCGLRHLLPLASSSLLLSLCSHLWSAALYFKAFVVCTAFVVSAAFVVCVAFVVSVSLCISGCF